MFNTVTEIGNLTIDEVFGYYDGPRLFSCRSGDGNYYIAIHVDDDGDNEVWLLAPVSTRRLEEVRTGRISLHGAFRLVEGGRVWNLLVSSDARDVLRYDFMSVDSVGDEILPSPNARLALESRVEAVVSTNTIWSAIDSIAQEAIQGGRLPTSIQALKSLRHVVDISLSNVNYPKLPAIHIDALGRSLTRLQSLFDAAGQAFFDRPTARGAVPSRIKDQTRLLAIHPFPGSFGIRLESDNNDLFGSDTLTPVFESVALLFQAGDNEAYLLEVLDKLGPRTAAHYRSLARILASARANFTIEVGVPNRAQSVSATLPYDRLSNLINILERQSEKVVETLTIAGELIGVETDPIKRRVHIKSVEHDINCGVADNCAHKLMGLTIGGIYEATFSVRIDVIDISGEEKVTYKLIDIN